jgi:hypothetical protein
MNDFSRTSLITQENEAFALMSRLHVVLRREVSRVIDIKYMAINPEYCRNVLEFARDLGRSDIDTLADKLEYLYFKQKGLFEFSAAKDKKPKRPAIALTPTAKVAKPVPLLTETAELAVLENEGVSSAYVGRLR